MERAQQQPQQKRNAKKNTLKINMISVLMKNIEHKGHSTSIACIDIFRQVRTHTRQPHMSHTHIDTTHIAYIDLERIRNSSKAFTKLFGRP